VPAYVTAKVSRRVRFADPPVLASIRDHIVAVLVVAALLSTLALWIVADQLKAPVTTQERCYIDTRDPTCVP
jgi:hypothetical protein